jgi:hypothetical protein
LLAAAAALTIVGTLSSAPAKAQQPLAARPLLQRLSLKLRGRSPTAAEVAAFEQRVAVDPGGFQGAYDATVRAYLASPEFRDVIEDFHAVWWRMGKRESTRLAATIVTEDRSYLEIFSRDWTLLDGDTANVYEYAGIRTEVPLPTEGGDWRVVRLADDEPRFRSVLSGLDLLNRFPDTPTNRNRARASHVFRTFLCETLAPPTDAAHLAPVGPVGPVASDGDDEHGTNPDCIGCHYRLDPLARFFDHWRPVLPSSGGTWYDAAEPAQGSLIVRENGADARHYDGTGESALGRALAAEPQVRRCIAKKAWELAFGPGVKLPSEAEAHLVAAFDQRHSFKDLLTETLRHPWFWSTEEPPPLRFADMSSEFRQCGCHHPDSGITRFDPLRYPFDPDPARNTALLQRIWRAVSYRSGYRPMPDAPRPQLPSDALARMKEWISAGAFDDTLQPTLTDDQAQEVLSD